MKIISLLSAAALVGLGVSIIDLSLSIQSFGIFIATASILFLLGVVRDYAPRRPYWESTASNVVRFPRRPASAVVRLAA